MKMMWTTRMSKAKRLTVKTSRTSIARTTPPFRVDRMQAAPQAVPVEALLREAHVAPVAVVVVADVALDKVEEAPGATAAPPVVRRAKALLHRGTRVTLRRGPFLRAAESETKSGIVARGTSVTLPEADRNWMQNDPSQDLETTYREIREGAPAGSLSPDWK